MVALPLVFATCPSHAKETRPFSSRWEIGQSPKVASQCKPAESVSPESAQNSYSPIPYVLVKALRIKEPVTIDKLSIFTIKLLEPPSHGKTSVVYEPSKHWTYTPEEGYTGDDQAAFQVDAKGKTFKVIVNFAVVPFLPYDPKDYPSCKQ